MCGPISCGITVIILIIALVYFSDITTFATNLVRYWEARIEYRRILTNSTLEPYFLPYGRGNYKIKSNKTLCTLRKGSKEIK